MALICESLTFGQPKLDQRDGAGFPRVLKKEEKNSGPEKSWIWALVLKNSWKVLILITVVLKDQLRPHVSCDTVVVKQFLLVNLQLQVLQFVFCCAVGPKAHIYGYFELVRLYEWWSNRTTTLLYVIIDVQESNCNIYHMPGGHCIFGITFTVSCSAIWAIVWGQKCTKIRPDFWYVRSWEVLNFYPDIYVGKRPANRKFPFESNQRIVIYSFNVKFLLIAI